LRSQMHHPPAGAGSTATAETCLFSRWTHPPIAAKTPVHCLFGREALTGFRPICFGKLGIPSPCITPAI
ncbi:hypothetical protein P691DRAFT_804417, partial [Macrolepiota fuliginosa MF-IS2]